MQSVDSSAPADGLFDRVSRSGFTMADVCREAGVARSTPSRWRAMGWEPKGRTLRSLDEALAALIARREEASSEAA